MSLLSLAYFMTLTPALLLAAVLIKRSAWGQPGRILAVLVLLMAYKLFEGALMYSGGYQYLPHALDWLPAVALILGPVFYAYVCRMSGHRVWAWKRWLLHLVPAAVLMALNAPAWFVPASQKVQMYQSILANPGMGELPWLVVVLLVAIKLHLGTYLAQSWRLLGQAKGAAEAQTADATRLSIQWLSRLCLMLIALEAVWVMLFLGHQLMGLTTLDAVSQAWLLFMGAVVLLMGYWGLQQPERVLIPWPDVNMVALGRDDSTFDTADQADIKPVAKMVSKAEPTPKYENSVLEPETAAALAQEIQKALSQDQLHLQSDLNLTGLSEHLGIRKHLVSQVINQTLNTTFFKLINATRVRHAQSLLDDPGLHFTLERIAQESGFNNRVTFNKAFKAEMGCSPSVYRKQLALVG